MRTHLGRLVLGAVIAVAGMLLLPPTAFACSCVSADEAYFARHADAVFTGTVRDRDDPRSFSLVQSSGDPITYEVAVDAVYKGRVGPVAEVTSARDGATCGVSVDVGDRYLVYADRDPQGDLSASSCGGTREVGAAPAGVDPVLGEPAAPDTSVPATEDRSSTAWGVAGVAAVLLGLFAVARAVPLPGRPRR